MTAIDMTIPLPDYAAATLDALERAGFEAWCVGGCVRDSMLGRNVNDYDVTTNAHWEDAERALFDSGFAVHRTGTKHGTVTASLDGHAVEVTTFRSDGQYSDGRHPDDVAFVQSIEEDLARRDFTINALAYHPNRGVLDCWGGIADMERGTIRVVGDAFERFREDSLRILRGCRFASQLGFTIEPATFQAMKACKMGLLRVSSERITHEIDGLLLGDHVHDALMETVDVLVAVMPEIAACKGFDQHSPYHIYDVWEHTAWVVQHSPAHRLARWAALFHDIGKPGAFFMDGPRGHFYGHPKLSVILARDIMKRLSFSPSFEERVLDLVREHDRQIPATSRAVKRELARLNGDIGQFRALCDLKKADAMAHSNEHPQRLELANDLMTVLDEVIAANEAFTVGDLAIDGNDIKTLGIPVGPEIGRALDACLDAVIDELIPNDRDALMRFVRSMQR